MHRGVNTLQFNVIGITETKENVNKGFMMNNNLEGYDLYTQPSKSAAGGVALYVSNQLKHNERSDLNFIYVMNLNVFGSR